MGVPQELGGLDVLIHGGWSKWRALLLNLGSASAFLLSGLVAYAVCGWIDVGFLVPFVASNLIYIGASDLVPAVNKHHDIGVNVLRSGSVVAGIALLRAIRVAHRP